MTKKLIKELSQIFEKLPITTLNLKSIEVNSKDFSAVKYKVNFNHKTNMQLSQSFYKPISQISIHEE